jgi:hypothetical protein
MRRRAPECSFSQIIDAATPPIADINVKKPQDAATPPIARINVEKSSLLLYFHPSCVDLMTIDCLFD